MSKEVVDKLQDDAADDFNDFEFLKEAIPNTPQSKDDEIPDGIGLTDEVKPDEEIQDPPAGDETKDDADDATVDDKPIVDEGGDEDKGEQPKKEGELFYDPKRDFPDQEAAAPTTYKDEVSAYEGIVHKISYLEKLGEDLKALKSGFGAIDLPEFLENPEAFSEYKDITKIAAEFDADSTRKAVFDLDKTIKLVKDKLNRVETSHKEQEQSTQVDKEYTETLQAAVSAIDLLGIKPEESWSNDELIANVQKAREDFRENADEFVDEHGIKEYNKKLDEYDKAISDVRKFVDASVKKASFKPAEKAQEITPEQREAFWNEFKEDQGHLPMFKAPTDAPQIAFLEFVRAKQYKIESPRSFIKAHKDYQAKISELRSKKGLSDVRKTVEEIRKETHDQRQKRVLVERQGAYESKSKPIEDEFDADIDHLLDQAFAK